MSIDGGNQGVCHICHEGLHTGVSFCLVEKKSPHHIRKLAEYPAEWLDISPHVISRHRGILLSAIGARNRIRLGR